jgi:xanthine dehydrogenase accessory factor
VVIRGGGDLATGVAWRLHRAGFPLLVLELAEPLTVRRTVALSSAVQQGSVDVEGMRGVLARSLHEAAAIQRTGDVAVMVAPDLAAVRDAGTAVVVDARLAKRNIDTSLIDAPLVVALGPGFTAGVDCHAVVETMRGHRLGRVLWEGSAAPNTGVPGEVGGRGAERVLRAPVSGVARWHHEIGHVVAAGVALGSVEADNLSGDHPVTAPFRGIVRGLVAAGSHVREGQKIGDVDPRVDPSAVHTISDKALAVGGGVLEAVTTWLHRST